PTFQLTAFRLQADGELDTTFGTDGVFLLPAADYGLNNFGTSIVLDPDGRIVIAGSQDEQLIVLRLLPNGSLDDTFGISGVFSGPENLDRFGAYTKILRTGAGGYRISIANAAGCQLVALTSDGTLDSGFGIAGISTIDTPSGPATSCSSVVTQPDGRLLVAGSTVGKGFATRLLANGQSDPGFSASAVSGAVASATALAVGDDGSIAVAHAGVNGAEIMRLLADGTLDVLFGNAGSTLIDLASDGGTSPIVYDLDVRPDGSVVGAGGDAYSGQAFVVRLLGSAGGDSPGVLGVAHQSGVTTAEDANEVVVNVRRSGGDFGSVSVAYQTTDGISGTATVGQDYSEVSGRLFWGDGDRTDREVRIPILADANTEEPETFALTLSDAQGGAGLATRSAAINISADGSPHGQFSIDWDDLWVIEGDTLEFPVFRNYYNGGAVSVTLTPVGETATGGDDFVPDPITLTWGDGDAAYKWARIAIRNDTDQEPIETFRVELSNPTGGALIGPRSSTRVTIDASDRPAAQPKTGGGGAWGFLSLLLLGGLKLGWASLSAVRSRRK
ncbi:MAG: hypothetical protein OEY72_05830, partial [Gammaproteobacteria bacterium]|nr:hypothetical protein [Gammaproteobacteria bacterium]